MDTPDIRWKQRFANYRKAYRLFRSALAISEPDDVERMGLIQAFEMTFELSWKVLKDYLSEQGQVDLSPRSVLRRAYQFQLIDHGEQRLTALECRNRTSHSYDHASILAIETEIRTLYAVLFEDLLTAFEARL